MPLAANLVKYLLQKALPRTHVSLCTGKFYFLAFALFSERSCWHSLTINRQQRGLHGERKRAVHARAFAKAPQKSSMCAKRKINCVLLYAQAKNCHISGSVWMKPVHLSVLDWWRPSNFRANPTDKWWFYDWSDGLMVEDRYFYHLGQLETGKKSKATGGRGVLTKVGECVKGKILRVDVCV